MHPRALPFILERSDDRIDGSRITSTSEIVHGLLRLDAAALVVQWRMAREIEHVGTVIRTERELEPVREVVIPLDALGAVSVRERRWLWFRRRLVIVLTAADLHAFEEVAGAAGLKLEHPATLMLPVPEPDRVAAIEFAAELSMRVADHVARLSAGDTRSRATQHSSTRALHTSSGGAVEPE